MRLSFTRRAQNACKDCGYTWIPEGKDLSRTCPRCGGSKVACDTRRYTIVVGLVIAIAAAFIFGKWAPDSVSHSNRDIPHLADMRPTPTAKAGDGVARGDELSTSTEQNPTAMPNPNPPPRAEYEKHMSVEENKREAVRRYPELAVPNSKTNAEFVRRYRLYQQTRPEFFRQPTWPLSLAEEVEASQRYSVPQ